MTTASDSPSDIAFDKMMTAAFETCDALSDFYSHMDDVKRNALAGTPLPEMDTIKITGAVHEAHDRYYAAACEFGDLQDTCAECQAEEAAKVPATPVVPPVATNRGFH